ncbi:Uncharacterised protein [Mycobacteroides abscessus subsp. abscessus]|nr:Uncharacterised protein [Mycobacteroides abscessus subsp. abscessus]
MLSAAARTQGRNSRNPESTKKIGTPISSRDCSRCRYAFHGETPSTT